MPPVRHPKHCPTHAGPPCAGSADADEYRGSLDPHTPGEREWRPWLAGGSSREVLARIVGEDPLRVRDHVARELSEGAYLLDAHRVTLRCFALIARHALKYRGRPVIDEWLTALARESIAAIVREDGDAERRPFVHGQEPGREHGEAFWALARPLGLEPDAMGRACLAFNRLPQAERSAFFALVLQGRTLDELVRTWGEKPTEIARRARRALDTLLSAATPPGAHSHDVSVAREDAPQTPDSETSTPKDR
ncbi:MAG: hypothetical protein JNL28_06940 [Planctomycetes bacterium]|nr:hypothetical protein [Planctomycetota bacterium]